MTDQALIFTEHEDVAAEIVGSKFGDGNGEDGKHYWLTPANLLADLNAEFAFDFDPCPYPLPAGFDGLTCEWGQSNYVNPPFGSIVHDGKKKGPTAWARKAIAENAQGKRVVLVYPIDKWILMLLAAGAKARNLGDVRWCATEDGSQGNGTGRHIACFVLEPAEARASDRNPKGGDANAAPGRSPESAVRRTRPGTTAPPEAVSQGIPQGVEARLIERLKEAVEGECDGLALTDDHARAILEYVLQGEQKL